MWGMALKQSHNVSNKREKYKLADKKKHTQNLRNSHITAIYNKCDSYAYNSGWTNVLNEALAILCCLGLS